MKGIEAGSGAAQLKDPQQVINLQMNNVFNYEVKKPRRDPNINNVFKPLFKNQFGSLVYECYVLDKARSIDREFSFRDFLELELPAFHRIVKRLVRKGKVMANPSRSVPKCYFLVEKLSDYKR